MCGAGAVNRTSVALMGQFREQRGILHGLMALRGEWIDGRLAASPARRDRQRQRQRRLTEEESQALAQAYRDGATLLVLAEQFGVARVTVLAHLDRQGVPRRHLAGMSPDEVEQASRRYQAGDSFATIGAALGFSPNTVRKYLMAAGASIRLPWVGRF